MSTIAGSHKVCKEISDALGLKNVRKLDLHMACGEVVTITAEFFPEVDGVKQLPAILKTYELHEVVQEEAEST